MPKSKWDEVKSKLILIEGWARDGLIEEQIAKNLGIGISTLSKYKVEHVELVEALKKGKEVVDFEVENKLLKRALGYEYTEVTKERILKRDETGKPLKNPDGSLSYEMIVTKSVKKEVVPDTTAQIFWLKNRKPLSWRDKQELNHSGEMNINNPFKGLSSEELKNLAKMSDDNG